MHPVVTAEQVVAYRNDIMEQAGGQEEEDNSSKDPCNESGMGVNCVSNLDC